MKKNKAFTLVELLAVIVILGLLALIIVPKVQKTIKNSKKNIYESSAYALKREADNFYLTRKTELTSFDGCTYDFTNNDNTCTGFDFKGKKPDSGILKITNDGRIAIAIKIENYCYKKGYNENEITVIQYNEDTCYNNGRLFISYNIPETVTIGDGLYESTTEPGRLIYRGANPNNYINIKEDGTNNTLYRIVSYEPDGTIKVVRNESIDNIAWDKLNARKSDGTNNTFCEHASSYGCNVWGSGTTTLYNGQSLGDDFHYIYYISADTPTLTNGPSGTVSTESTLNQYLNSKTNNSTNSWQPAIVLEQYMDNHSWNVGGINSTGEDKGIIKEKEEERQLQWTGKVALLNITEFAEASTNSECTSVKSNYGSASGSPCKESNWTFKGIKEWSLSPISNSRIYVLYVYSDGCFAQYDANISFGVRPAFYLKSDISLSGTGTEANPYRIVGM